MLPFMGNHSHCPPTEHVRRGNRRESRGTCIGRQRLDRQERTVCDAKAPAHTQPDHPLKANGTVCPGPTATAITTTRPLSRKPQPESASLFEWVPNMEQECEEELVGAGAPFLNPFHYPVNPSVIWATYCQLVTSDEKPRVCKIRWIRLIVM